MTISPDGQTLLACCQWEITKCWNLHTGKLENYQSWGAGNATSIAISPDGQTLTSGNTNGTIQLWNLHTGEELRSFVRYLGRTYATGT